MSLILPNGSRTVPLDQMPKKTGFPAAPQQAASPAPGPMPQQPQQTFEWYKNKILEELKRMYPGNEPQALEAMATQMANEYMDGINGTDPIVKDVRERFGEPKRNPVGRAQPKPPPSQGTPYKPGTVVPYGDPNKPPPPGMMY